MRSSVRLNAQTALGLVSAGVGIGSYFYNTEKRTYIDVCSALGAAVSGVYVAASVLGEALEASDQSERTVRAPEGVVEKATNALTEVTAAAGLGGLIAYGGALSLDAAARQASVPFVKMAGYVAPLVQHLAPVVAKAFKYYGNMTSAVSGGVAGAAVADAFVMAGEAASGQKVPEQVRSILYTAAAGGGGALLHAPMGSFRADTARFLLSLVIFGSISQGVRNYRKRRTPLAEGGVDMFKDVRFLDVVQNSPWVFAPTFVVKTGVRGVESGVRGVNAVMGWLFGAGSEEVKGKKKSVHFAPDVDDVYQELTPDPDMPSLEEVSDSEPSSPRAASRPPAQDVWVHLGGNMRDPKENKAYEKLEKEGVKKKIETFMWEAKPSQFFDKKAYTADDKIEFGAGFMGDRSLIWVRKAGDEENRDGGFRFIHNDMNILGASEGKVTFTRSEDADALSQMAGVIQEMGAALPESAAKGAFGKGRFCFNADDVRPIVWTEVVSKDQRPGSQTKLMRFV